MSVELKPYERLIDDITGVASISRAQHRALQGRPIIDAAALAAPIDAEVVEPAAEDAPARPAESPEDGMRDAEGYDDDGDDMPPASGLMTLEDAAEAEWQAGRRHG